MKFLSKIFGATGILKDVSDIADRFITTPQERREFEEAIKERLRSHELEAMSLANADRDSARNREVTLRNTLGVWAQNISAIAVIFGFMTLLYIVLMQPLPLSDRQATMADILLGTLGSIVIQIFQYWFGSSEGSRKKDDRSV
jgi:hypothetical protein